MFARKPGKGITLEMSIRNTQVNKKIKRKKKEKKSHSFKIKKKIKEDKNRVAILKLSNCQPSALCSLPCLINPQQPT